MPKQPRPCVNHYSFHILDPDWGHLTIKMSGHPRCDAEQSRVGGLEAQTAGIGFLKQDNCFTTLTNAADLAKVAGTLSRDEIAGRLLQLCERWIYTTCLCFALDLEEQRRSTFRYQYSVFQIEYSRNLLFHSGRQMDEIFQVLIDRARGPLNLDRIKTIFGDKSRPHYDKRKKNPTRWGVVVEKPAYDVTIFKVNYGKMTLKIYTKGERVLRIEVIEHNTEDYRWGWSLPCFPEIVIRLQCILERFLNAVGCMDACFVGGIDLNKLRMHRVADAVLTLSSSPHGIHGFGSGGEGPGHERRTRFRIWCAPRRL